MTWRAYRGRCAHGDSSEPQGPERAFLGEAVEDFASRYAPHHGGLWYFLRSDGRVLFPARCHFTRATMSYVDSMLSRDMIGVWG